MTTLRILTAIAALFCFALAWNGLVHMVVLKEANQALLDIARPAEERNMVLTLLLTLGVVTTFVLSFCYWARQESMKEGLVHGGLFAILAGLFVDLNQYVIYPLPAELPSLWFIFRVVEFLVYGLIVSALYRRRVAA